MKSTKPKGQHGVVEQVVASLDDVLPEARALNDVDRLQQVHQYDPNLPDNKLQDLDEAVKTGNVEKALEVDDTFTKESPYETVRAAVRETDGEEIANTVRAWLLGFIFVTLSSGINMLLSMRSPAITIPTVVILLVVYPCGQFLARILPTKKFKSFGLEWTLNTGPFTIKEHTVVVLMANVTYGYAYSTDALLALKAKSLYNLDMGWGFQILFTLSSQVIGIAFAGIFRRFLIPLTFDWTYVTAYLGDPLLSPIFSHLNTIIGLGVFMIITTLGKSSTAGGEDSSQIHCLSDLVMTNKVQVYHILEPSTQTTFQSILPRLSITHNQSITLPRSLVPATHSISKSTRSIRPCSSLRHSR
jgi:hypothetical protein